MQVFYNHHWVGFLKMREATNKSRRNVHVLLRGILSGQKRSRTNKKKSSVEKLEKKKLSVCFDGDDSSSFDGVGSDGSTCPLRLGPLLRRSLPSSSLFWPILFHCSGEATFRWPINFPQNLNFKWCGGSVYIVDRFKFEIQFGLIRFIISTIHIYDGVL